MVVAFTLKLNPEPQITSARQIWHKQMNLPSTFVGSGATIFEKISRAFLFSEKPFRRLSVLAL